MPTLSIFFLNIMQCNNKEFFLLCASQGGANSCLYMQRAISGILHRVNDQMILRDCFQPLPIAQDQPELQKQFLEEQKSNSQPISLAESWLSRPQLDQPGPLLLPRAQAKLLSHPRKVSDSHILPLDRQQREVMLNQSTEDVLISRSALIDDIIISSKSKLHNVYDATLFN